MRELSMEFDCGTGSFGVFSCRVGQKVRGQISLSATAAA